MRRMTEDAQAAGEIFWPGPYWRPHADEIIKIIDRSGIGSFRSIPEKALTAFGAGTWGRWMPEGRLAVVDSLMQRVPLARDISRAYRREIEGGYVRASNERLSKLRLMHEFIRVTDIELASLTDTATGGAVTFKIGDKNYSELFLNKLYELALLRQRFDFSKTYDVIEIGGGFGLMGELLTRLFPKLNYTIVDLAPIAALAQYYLETTSKNVAGYDDSPSRITVRCAHQIDAITGRFDLLMNTASLQEMSRPQVEHYMEFAKNRANAVYLFNSDPAPANGIGSKDYIGLLLPKSVVTWKHPLHPGDTALLAMLN